jgi:hypothetical protein
VTTLWRFMRLASPMVSTILMCLDTSKLWLSPPSHNPNIRASLLARWLRSRFLTAEIGQLKEKLNLS